MAYHRKLNNIYIYIYSFYFLSGLVYLLIELPVVFVTTLTAQLHPYFYMFLT